MAVQQPPQTPLRLRPFGPRHRPRTATERGPTGRGRREPAPGGESGPAGLPSRARRGILDEPSAPFVERMMHQFAPVRFVLRPARTYPRITMPSVDVRRVTRLVPIAFVLALALPAHPLRAQSFALGLGAATYADTGTSSDVEGFQQWAATRTWRSSSSRRPASSRCCRGATRVQASWNPARRSGASGGRGNRPRLLPFSGSLVSGGVLRRRRRLRGVAQEPDADQVAVDVGETGRRGDVRRRGALRLAGPPRRSAGVRR